jgi:hypothetical protein
MKYLEHSVKLRSPKAEVTGSNPVGCAIALALSYKLAAISASIPLAQEGLVLDTLTRVRSWR